MYVLFSSILITSIILFLGVVYLRSSFIVLSSDLKERVNEINLIQTIHYALGNKITYGIFTLHGLTSEQLKGPSWDREVACWEPSAWHDIASYVALFTNNIEVNGLMQERLLRYAFPRSDWSPTKFKQLREQKHTHPVVHFRCADVPFNRHNSYCLPTQSSLLAIAAFMRQQPYSRYHLLLCTQHNHTDSNRKQKCHSILDRFLEHFPPEIEFITSCGSVENDFATMYQAPLVIALVNSSFSFTSKIHNLSQYHTIWDGDTRTRDVVPWFLPETEPLLHEQVNNYNNIEELLEKHYPRHLNTMLGF